MTTPPRPRPFFTFGRKLFLACCLLFLAVAVGFIVFQYGKEKEYRIGLLHTRLQGYNNLFCEYLAANGTLDPDRLDSYIRLGSPEELRVTVIDTCGNVCYDNLQHDPGQISNHTGRKEIADALRTGRGYAIHRLSQTVGSEFFYSATYCPRLGCVVRSALPYNVSLVRYLRADSRSVWLLLGVTLVLAVVLFRFVYRLYCVKEALGIEREKLITHLRLSHEGLGIFGADGKEVFVNSLFTQYICLLSDRGAGSPGEMFSIPELSPLARFVDRRRLAAATGEQRTKLTVAKDGRTFALACIIFADGSFELSVNDITHEEEQANIKRQLTQNIAHELKTPVCSIQGYLETIISHPLLPPERVVDFLKRSYAQSNRLANLVRDIAALTRMEEVSHRADHGPVCLHALVQSIFHEVEPELKEQRITARNLLPPDLVVRGDSSLLYSIFRNLADNALAYAGTDTEFTVRCFKQDGHLCHFSVADTGTGVASEHLGRLFERFYRVDKGRSRKLGGTGLGLAIVKNAVNLHGGTIFARNAPGGGLELIFTLAREGVDKAFV